jgi:hypothetical protein
MRWHPIFFGIVSCVRNISGGRALKTLLDSFVCEVYWASNLGSGLKDAIEGRLWRQQCWALVGEREHEICGLTWCVKPVLRELGIWGDQLPLNKSSHPLWLLVITNLLTKL